VRILLVDDSALVRQRLLELFGEAEQLELHEAGNVEDARRLLDSTAIELAVVDMRLGGDSGLDLIGEIKQRRPGATVIVVTNDATAAHERACLTRGADFFFDKSRDFERVAALVQHLARRVVERRTG
jgi:two-component system, NarL family, response regulator DevR